MEVDNPLEDENDLEHYILLIFQYEASNKYIPLVNDS